MDTEWKDKNFVDWYNNVLRFHPHEVVDYLASLNLNAKDIFIDFGCGAGTCLSYAATKVNLAIGIDESSEQLSQVVSNVHPHQNILLAKVKFQDFNYNFLKSLLASNPQLNLKADTFFFSKCSARKSLHHLTDQEKESFFKTISPLLAPNALFLIEDAIYGFDKNTLEENYSLVLNDAKNYYQDRWPAIEEQFIFMLKHEHPTDIKTWISILHNAGLELIFHRQHTSFFGKILARKSQENFNGQHLGRK
ncbi:MAG: class I SAM-dependent methyltransferase [Oligoflexia bacterium]|nr:class I SAM-dependent methyltransferase [Oligoflexia bacterium]